VPPKVKRNFRPKPKPKVDSVINASLSEPTSHRQRSQLPRLSLHSQSVYNEANDPCVWRILCFRNSSSVPYFRQPPNLPTEPGRNRKCTECGTTAFGRNRMSAESTHLSTFGTETETEAEIRSTSKVHSLSTLPNSRQCTTSVLNADVPNASVSRRTLSRSLGGLSSSTSAILEQLTFSRRSLQTLYSIKYRVGDKNWTVFESL